MGRLFWFTCFESFFLIEITSFINIFSPCKSIPFSFNSAWWTFSSVTINANPLLFPDLLMKSMLIKKFCLKYCADLKPKSSKRSFSLVSLCTSPINSCFFSEILLFVFNVWFPSWFPLKSLDLNSLNEWFSCFCHFKLSWGCFL